MRIVIEVESVEELRRVCADLVAQAEPEAPAKGKRAPKPTEPVKGNPDAPAESAETPAAKPTPSVAPPAATSEPAALPKALRADAPDELVRLLTDESRDAVGKAVLRAAKPKEEGGLTKAALMSFLEPLLGVPAGTPVKLGMIGDDKLAAVRAHLLSEYKA